MAGLAVLVMTAGSAHAAPTYCVPGPNTDGLTTGDVEFRGSNSDDCYGVVTSDNDDLTDLNTIWGTKYGGGNFGAVVGDGGGSTSFLGLNWSLAADVDQTSGDFTLSITDPAPASLPVTVDIAVVLKAGNDWATYFFDNETFTIVGGAVGEFAINFLNNGGEIPQLSHMNVYLRQGTGAGGGSTQTVVPEPASLLLLGTGLSAAAWRVRRRRRVAATA